MNIRHTLLTLSLLSTMLPAHASFIESTLGTAVVNDAVATYYNPAGLTQLKNPQFIPLGSAAYISSNFTGQYAQPRTGFTQSGSSSAQSTYYLPSFYLGIPTTNKITLGFAVVSNLLTRDIEGNSILRYAQSSNSIQNIDLVPAAGFKINDYLSIGAGINFSYANFLLKPVTGAPGLNIPDNQSRNESNGTGIGGDIGFQIKANPSTMIGFNYRSAITYHLSGKSMFEGNPEVTSNHYGFTYWTPARAVISINQFVTPALGFIGTVQRIQWSIFQNIRINGIATLVGAQPRIVNATVPQYLHDSWLITLGSHYRIIPKWVVRIAGSYNQSAGNRHYQIANGDSFIIGASSGYEINKNITIDGSYAHVFMKNENINIVNTRNVINGVNGGEANSVSLKLTVNVC